MPATTTKLSAYFGDPSFKAEFIKELKWHKKQGKFLHGSYGEGSNGDFRGCAVGCSIHSLYRLGKTKEKQWEGHALYPSLLGVTEWLAWLADSVFENSPEDYSMSWPVRVMEAVPVGVDLTLVKHTVMAMILEEETKFDRKKFPQVAQAVSGTAELHRQASRGETVTPAAWSAAESAAWSAADSATFKRIGDKTIKILRAVQA